MCKLHKKPGPADTVHTTLESLTDPVGEKGRTVALLRPTLDRKRAPLTGNQLAT